MRTKAIAAASLATLLIGAWAGTASAGDGPEYAGRIEKDPTTWFGFDVSGSGDSRKVKHLFVFNVSVACNDGDGGRRGFLQVGRNFNVSKQGRFHGTGRAVQLTKQNAPTYFVRVSGKLKPSGKKAAGEVELKLAGDTRCYSGTLDWKARKPPVPPPGAGRRR